MSLDKLIKDGADRAIQEATGLPAPQLRGRVGPSQMMQEFIAAKSAQGIDPGKEFATAVTRASTVLESTPLATVEPATPFPAGVGQTNSDTVQLIAAINGTAEYYTFTATDDGPV